MQPALTKASGKFTFDANQTMELNDTTLYSFASASGYIYQDTLFKTISEWIEDSPVNLVIRKPEVTILTDTLVCLGDTSYFNSEISGGVPPYTYLWASDSQTTTVQKPHYPFPSIGIYDVKLTVTDTMGCKDTAHIAINVISCGQPQLIDGYLLHGMSCGSVPVPDAKILLISSAHDTINTFTKTDSLGKFVCDLALIPNLDTTKTYIFGTKQGYVIPQQQAKKISVLINDSIVLHVAKPQIVKILTDTVVCVGNTSFFNAQVMGGVYPYSFLWTYNGISSTEPNPHYQFPLPGNYTVKLTIIDALECIGTKTVTINVKSCVQPKIISGTLLHSNACDSMPVKNAMMLLVGLPKDTVFTYVKTDIDGKFTIDVAQLPNLDTTQNYIFATQQGYLLEQQQPKTISTLINGGNIVLHLAQPQVTIQTETLICLGDTSYFSSKIIGGVPPYTYLWTSNGTTTNSENPEYILPFPGTYKIELTVTDALGCGASAGTSINVSPCEIKGFLYENYSCGGAPVIGDTLIFKQKDAVGDTIATAVTGADGSYSLKYDKMTLFNNLALYSIESESCIGITDMQARTIGEWQQMSSVNLYYTTLLREEWVEEYYGIDSLGATAITMDVNDNIYIAGTSNSSSGQNYLVMKYNPAGELQWAATDSSIAYSSVMRAVAVDSVENVYVTGSSNDIVTAKYDTDGNRLWLSTFSCGDLASVYNNYISLDYDGNIVVAVSRTSYFPSTDYYWEILKYSPTGQILWTKKYITDSESNSVLSLSVDSLNNIIVSESGWTIGQTTDVVYLIVKFDNNGNVVWEKRYLGANNSNEFISASTVDNQGNIIVLGTFNSLNSDREIKTFKYAPDGNLLWEATYNGPSINNDWSRVVLTDNSGNIYVCGTSWGSAALGDMFLTIKYDPMGNELWVRKYTYKNNNSSWLYYAVLDIEGSVYLSGVTNSILNVPNYLTVKINSDGVFQWAKTYNVYGSNNDYVNKALVSNNGDVYITGTHYNMNIPNIFTIKYSQCPSLVQTLRNQSQDNNSNVALTQTENYQIGIMPNPYNNYTNIAYEIYDASNVQIEVYSVTGQKIQEIENSKQEAGYYHYTFSAQKLGFTPGLYMLRIRINNEVQNFKLMELKN